MVVTAAIVDNNRITTYELEDGCRLAPHPPGPPDLVRIPQIADCPVAATAIKKSVGDADAPSPFANALNLPF